MARRECLRHFCAIAVLLITGAAASGPLSADIYILTANVPVRVAAPIQQASGDMVVFIKAKGGQWQQPQYQVEGDRIILSPNPKELGGTELFLVINPPPELDLSDDNPPILLGIKGDGKPLRLEAVVDMGATLAPPQVLTWGVADRENALDLASLKVVLDGELVIDDRVSVTAVSSRQAGITVNLGDLEYGSHEISVKIADAFPQSNELQLKATVTKLATTNWMQAASDSVEVKVDSHYMTSYPSVAPLTDGFCGEGSSNDVTWASAEDDQPHWIEIKLPQPRPLKEVTVYWANTGSTFHTSQNVQVQVPEDGGWKTVYTSPKQGLGAERCTTFFFDEVTTDRFRVYQPAGGGTSQRPNLMWVAEVEAR